MNSTPLCSVVLPNFNGGDRLARAIQSVLSQSLREVELVVVDGKSTDGSHDVLRAATAADDRLKWVQEADLGLSDAINLGVGASRGEVIGYLGNDDEYLPGILEYVAWMSERVDFDALLCPSYTYWVQERKLVLQEPKVREISAASLLEHGTIVGLQNTFYRRRVFDEHQYDPTNKSSMDYALLWDLAIDTPARFFVFSERFASINYQDGNLSHNNPAQALEAAQVALGHLQHMPDYRGPLWFQHLLSEG